MDILAYIGIKLTVIGLNGRITAGHQQEIHIILMDLGVMLTQKEDRIVVMCLYVIVRLFKNSLLT